MLFVTNHLKDFKSCGIIPYTKGRNGQIGLYTHILTEIYKRLNGHEAYKVRRKTAYRFSEYRTYRQVYCHDVGRWITEQGESQVGVS